MTILWLNLAIVFILSYLARYYAVIPLNSYLPATVKPSKLFVFLVMLLLVLVSGLRTNIGDTYVYKSIYETTDFTWEYILSQKDMGFGLLQKMLKMVSNDPQILLFTTAAITNILIILVFYKYSRMFELSTYVYITGGMFLVSMNGMRQLLAAAISFVAAKYLIERNPVKYFFIIGLASTIHISALVLLPMYFFVKYKAWSKANLVVLAFAVLIVLGYGVFSEFLFSAIQNTQYGQYQSFNEGGASVIRVAVSAAPVFLAYLGKERLREIFPESDYFVNMSLIGIAIMLVSTQNWIFARLAIYFDLYQLVLVGWVIKIFEERAQRFVYFAMIICYFCYYYFENVITLNIYYNSNFINLP